MKKLLGYADEYVKQSDWKDLAMIKFCLAAMGVLIGISLGEKEKKPAAWIAGGIFLTTYIPLMTKFFRVVLQGVHQSTPETD